MRILIAAGAVLALAMAPTAAVAGPGGFGEPRALARVPAASAVIDATTTGGVTEVLYAAGDDVLVLDDRPGARPVPVGAVPASAAYRGRRPGALASGVGGSRVAAWYDGPVLRAAIAGPGASFAASEEVWRAPFDPYGTVHAAVTADGALVLAWPIAGGVWATVRRPGSPAWPAPVRLGAANQLHVLAADARGGAILGWTEPLTPPPSSSGVGRFAVLPPGGDAFGPVQGDGETGRLLAVLPDGSSAFATGPGVRRRSPDGTFGPLEAGVPSDTAAASPEGGLLTFGFSTRPPGHLAADAPPGGAFTTTPAGPVVDRTLPNISEPHRWDGGAAAVVQRLVDDDEGILLRRRPAPGAPFTAPATVLGVDGVVAFGRDAGDVALYAVAARRLWTLRRPATADRRAPRALAASVRTRFDRSYRLTRVVVRAGEAASIRLRATIRGNGRRWSARLENGPGVTPALGESGAPIRIPRAAGCAPRITVAVTLRDSAGRTARRTVSARARCRGSNP